jgi:hypothetical protein
MVLRTREIYHSANGDRWSLALDSDTDRVFVRHEPNFPQMGKSLILRSEPFLLRLVAGQRNKNCCV